MRIRAITARLFPIPLKEPFTISRASVTSTRAVLVQAEVEHDDRIHAGLGEAALPLGDAETPEDLLASIRATAGELTGVAIDDLTAISRALDQHHRGSATARAGLCSALFDGFARQRDQPLHHLLGDAAAIPLHTDITLPIADPTHLATLARGYWERGFRSFKIKVGADLTNDKKTVALVAEATPNAKLRFDANEGYDADSAVALVTHTQSCGLQLECFEQPCARADLAGMRAVRERTGVPVVADEAVVNAQSIADLVAAQAVDGINLKLIKMGGIDRCLELGRIAQDLDLDLMVGAMIESRLGLTAMAHVAVALGGVAWVDLDTAFLLAEDPYAGGMIASGATLTLPTGAGLDISVRP